MTAEGGGPEIPTPPDDPARRDAARTLVADPALGLGTWEWNAGTGELWWSDEVYRILGLDRAAYTPHFDTAVDLTIPEDRWVHARDPLTGPPPPYSIHFRIRRSDGSVRTLREIGGASPRWSAENPLVIGTLLDVTDYALRDHPESGAALGATHAGRWRWNSANARIAVSRDGLALLGLIADGVISEAERAQAVHPDDRPRVQQVYADAARDRPESFLLRYRIVRPSGEVRYVEEDSHHTGNGAYEGRLTDITERQRMERNLLRIQDIAKLGTWERDPRSDTVWWSDQTYRLLGFEPGSIIPSRQFWLSLIHPEDAPRVIAAVAEPEANRESYTLHYRAIMPDGTIRFFMDQGEFRDGLEFGMLMDVTEQHRAARNLAEAQRIAGLGSWEVDAISGEIHWSAAMYRLVGLKAGTIRPTVAAWLAMIHEGDRERVQRAYVETSRSRQPYCLQYRLTRADGQTRYFQEECEFSDGRFAGYVIDITERHKTQLHLSRAQQIARIGSWEWNTVSDTTWLSPELYRMLGLDPARWQYSLEGWMTLVHPHDRARVRAVYTSAEARRGGFSLRFQLRQPDGSYRLYDEQGELNDDGTVTGVVWDITDITRAQRNMAEAQRIAKIGSWEWDLDRDEHWWSAECYRILGFDPETERGSAEAWFSLIHPEDVARTEMEFAAAIEMRRPYGYHYRIIRPDGQLRTVYETGEPIAQEKYAGTVMDITERVKIESRLAEAQRIAKLGSWEWNLETDEQWWSQEYYRICGLPSSLRPVTRQIWAESIHPDDLPPLLDLIASVERNPRAYSFRCRIRRRDGAVRVVQVHGEPVSDFGPGNPIIAGTLLDVTDRESMESQLQQAQKMEAVGQLTGGIAHDFNNLLGAILGNLDLLAEEIENRPRARALAERAIAAAESGAQLVRRLLAFSRRQPLNPQIVDLNAMVLNMLDLLRRTLGGRMQIETDLEPGPLSCRIDRPQTEGALLNLCINARDAMAGDGTVTIATRVIDLSGDVTRRPAGLAPGRYVELSVADRGTGMTPEVLQRAFEPFFTTKPPGQGSGLGLSMVYGFARQSGGQVAIDSTPGEGTEVRLLLPLHAAAERPESEPRRWVPSRPNGRELVLVVEDNADLRGYAVNTLLSFGYRTLSASTATAAIRLIDTRPDIGLLFTDIVFPEGPSGIELIAHVRKTRPDLPVLLTSGYLGDPEVRRTAREAATFTLHKPFRAPELGSKLTEIFGR
jgi:PAS domain S-box-containing protein